MHSPEGFNPEHSGKEKVKLPDELIDADEIEISPLGVHYINRDSGELMTMDAKTYLGLNGLPDTEIAISDELYQKIANKTGKIIVTLGLSKPSKEMGGLAISGPDFKNPLGSYHPEV